MLIHLTPQYSQFPEKGGVKEHLLHLYYHLSSRVNMTGDPNIAEILHVESAYPIPQYRGLKKIVYVCHGGFVPPLQVVYDNLERADIIISVADWLVDKWFPQYKEKTVVIPNGVDLWEFKPGVDQGYYLYGKEYPWNFDEFYHLTLNRPDLQFVSTVWNNKPQPSNVKVIGLQSSDSIKKWIAGATALVLTGSEVCPTMLLEAWACKVPVIAKNIDGSKELIERHGGGILYDSIDQIVDNMTITRYLGHQGYRAVEKHYQWKNLIRDYIKVYEKLLLSREQT